MTQEEAESKVKLTDEQKRLLEVPQGLWYEDEFEAVSAEVSMAAAAIPQLTNEVLAATWADEQPPADLRDPLKHIRALIIADVPNAELATDEELEILYDQWQAKQESET